MRRLLPLIALALCVSCAHKQTHTSHPQPQQMPAFHLVADTLRQGGLELLHNIAILNSDGAVLFTDSIEDYEPDHFSVLVPDTTHPEKCYLLLMVFDPCEERTLVLRSDGQTLHSLGIVPTDSLQAIVRN